ncbi:bifunctional folylpolyglutamate synthase/dihydrofolate synthase [Tuberibacillus sp. Marseille-P3662]|uniref:bifunctional folylpolyglutamate synthase/dihydrofolate synthase n=1 Tax=Tuberibacillus sp. Marseille-P3662 TaxID=1965358 RepID=UPI001594CEFD|nr:hypothetical protein [Tuberibacillus sp. Marseille-P3662]
MTVTYNRILSYLQTFHHRTINRDGHHLAIMRELLDVFQIDLSDFTIIQIAGSSGKGSTVLTLSKLLTANGIQHGRVISPHLERYEERFAIDDSVIQTDEFVSIIASIWRSLPSFSHERDVGHPHIMLLAAFLYFQNNQISLIIYENGVGGASDPANVLDPWIAVLTEMTLDHTHLLGPDIPSITKNKAAIIKPATDYVVCGMTNPEAKQILKCHQNRSSAQFYFYNEDYRLEHAFVYHGCHWMLTGLDLLNHANHQQQNITNALAVVNMLKSEGYPIHDDRIRRTLQHLSIPGRSELLNIGQHTLILDGAHNPFEIKRLFERFEPRDIDHLIISFPTNKSANALIAAIPDESIPLHIVPNPFQPGNQNFHDIRRELENAHSHIRFYDQLHESLTAVVTQPDPQTVLVTGSLYFIGQARTLLLDQDTDDEM